MPAQSKSNTRGFICPYSQTAKDAIRTAYNQLGEWMEAMNPQRLPAQAVALGFWRTHHTATYFAPVDEPDNEDFAQIDTQAKASYLGNFLRGYNTFKTEVMPLALSIPLVQISYLNGVACKGYNLPASLLQKLNRVQELATQRHNEIYQLTPDSLKGDN